MYQAGREAAPALRVVEGRAEHEREDRVVAHPAPTDGVAQVERAVAAGYHRLSRGQRLVVDRLIADTYRGAVLSAADLAADAGVSESTVTRAAQTLGFAGFPDLQARLRNSLAKGRVERLQVGVASLSDAPEEAARQVMLEDAENICATVEAIPPEVLRSAVDALIAARRVHIFGSRGSHGLALMLGLGLRMVLPDTRVIRQEAGELADQLVTIAPDDAVVAIGFHRVHRDTGVVARYAARVGARLIAVADRASSPIARHADIVLVARMGPPRLVSSHAVGASLVNALLTGAALRLDRAATARLQALEDLMTELQVHGEDGPRLPPF